MAAETVTVDNTTFSIEWVSSFSSVSDFVAAHATNEWLSPELLKNIYSIVNGEQPKEKKGSSK